MIHPHLKTPIAPELQIHTAEQYLAALKRHDWSFEYSDDSRTFRRGRDQRHALEAAQPLFDAKFQIWNSVAPGEYCRPRVRVEADDEFQCGQMVGVT